MRVKGWSLVIPLMLLLGCGDGAGGDAADVGPNAGSDVIDVIDCPDGLVYWEGYGLCAPPVPECDHPWEMPTVDGACVGVGPRACPKTWDPEADADCTPGEMLPCPEGFALTDGGIACVPRFDEDCGDDEIPVFGGGCASVGPRGCSKLWDPDTEEECEPGALLPCPEGLAPSEDGLSCESDYGDCPKGQRPLPDGGCAPMAPEAACPVAAFPPVPQDAGPVVHVLAGSTCLQDCGSDDAPFPSISAALSAAPEGGYVVVGPGTYAEGIRIARSLHLLGACAAEVTITGTTLSVGETTSGVLEAGLRSSTRRTSRFQGSALRAPSPVWP